MNRRPPWTIPRPILIPVALILAGCNSGREQPERRGAEALGRLPVAVAAQVPPTAILMHEEEAHDGAYRLWILREPSGTWIVFPKGKREGFEQRDMPPSALLSVLRSKRPSLETGQPREPRCLYTHWHDPDGSDLRIRQLLTDQGWFASVERVRP